MSSSILSRRWLVLPCTTALLLLGPLLSLAQARPGPHLVMARSGLTVHSGPGGRYRDLGALEAGARVTTLEERGPWRRIRFQGREGWVHGKYLRPVEAAPAPEEGEPPASGPAGSPSGGAHGNVVDRLEGRDAPPSGPANDVGDDDGEETDEEDEHGASEHAASPGEAATSASAVVPHDLPRSRAGFVQLPASGPGFTTYSAAGRRWGTTTMVYGLLRIGQRWAGRGPRMMVGDISLQNGGRMSGHASHRKGVDVDVRPVSKGGHEGPVTRHSSSYSAPLTHELVRLFRQELPISLIFFNDLRAPGVRKCKGHDNHFHARTSR